MTKTKSIFIPFILLIVLHCTACNNKDKIFIKKDKINASMDPVPVNNNEKLRNFGPRLEDMEPYSGLEKILFLLTQSEKGLSKKLILIMMQVKLEENENKLNKLFKDISTQLGIKKNISSIEEDEFYAFIRDINPLCFQQVVENKNNQDFFQPYILKKLKTLKRDEKNISQYTTYHQIDNIGKNEPISSENLQVFFKNYFDTYLGQGSGWQFSNDVDADKKNKQATAQSFVMQVDDNQSYQIRKDMYENLLSVDSIFFTQRCIGNNQFAISKIISDITILENMNNMYRFIVEN